MTGTLSGALAARGIAAVPGKLETDVEGEIVKADRTILVSRVRLSYHLKVPKGQREVAERAVAIHEQGCPIYQSLQRGIQVEWSADIEEE